MKIINWIKRVWNKIIEDKGDFVDCPGCEHRTYGDWKRKSHYKCPNCGSSWWVSSRIL